MKLSLDVETQGNHVVITAHGDVNLTSSPKLRSALLEAVGASESVVAIDLSGVRYMDSSGVATLVEGLRRAHETGAALRLVRPSKQVRSVLEMTRLDTAFEIEEAS
jgi:anti-sigma B factor antagonist